MESLVIFYSTTLLLTALLAFRMVAYTWRRNTFKGARPLALLLLGTALWALGYALEIWAGPFAWKMFWAKFQYVGIVVVPPAFLVFALEYAGWGRQENRRHLSWLIPAPLIFLLLVWTNDLHRLYWPQAEVGQGIAGLILEHGPAFYANNLYSHLLVLGGAIVVLKVFLNSAGFYRRQAGLILAAAFFPWLGNLLYVTHLSPFPDLDLTPFTFALTGIVSAWGFYRRHFLDLVPLARHALFEKMTEGVLVVDQHKHILDINHAAAQIIGKPASELIRQPLAVIGGDLVTRLQQAEQAGEPDLEAPIQAVVSGAHREYMLKIVPLHDGTQAAPAMMLVWSDVTSLKQLESARNQAEAALRRQLQEAQVLHAVALACVDAKEENELVEWVTGIIGSTMYPANFGLMMLDEGEADREEPTLRLHASYRGVPSPVKQIRLPVTRGLTGRAVLTGLPVRVGDVLRDPDYISMIPDALKEGLDEAFHETRSELCVPVRVSERLIAVINVESDQPQAFTEADERLLVTLAGQIATSIDRLRADAVERRRAQQAEMLYQAGKEIVASLDPQQIFEATCQAVKKVMPVDVFFISLLDEANQRLETTYLISAVNCPEPTFIPLAGSFSGQVARTLQPVWIRDLQQAVSDGDELSQGFLVGDPPHSRALMIVPLQLGPQVLGVLSVQCNEPNVYSAEDLRTFLTLANQVAIALGNARNYEESRRGTAYLVGLNAVIASAAAAQDLRQLLQDTLTHALRALGLEVGWVFVGQEKVVQNLNAEALERLIQEAHQIGVCSGEPLVVDDWRQAALTTSLQPLAGLMDVQGLRASINAPVVNDSKVVGGICLADKAMHAWDEDELAFLNAAGRQIGAAINRMGLMFETQERLREVSLLSTVIAATASATDIGGALEQVCREVALYLRAPQAGVALLSADKTEARVAAEYQDGDTPSALGASIPVAGNPSMEYILEHKAPLAVIDAQHDPRLAPVHEILRIRKVVSILIVPILMDGEVAGTLGIDTYEPRAYSAADMRLLQDVASQVGQVLERMHLYSATQQRAVLLARLAEVSAAISRSFTYEQVIKGVCLGAMYLNSANRSALFVRDAGDGVSCPWYIGLSEEYIQQVTQGARRMPGGKLLSQQEPVLITDVELLPDESPVKALAKTEGYRAYALWPLIYESATVAAVGCYFDAPVAWSESHLEVMLTFTRQCAVAIQNAHLFDETRSRALQLEALNEVMAAATSATSLSDLLSGALGLAMKALDVAAGAVWTGDHTVAFGLPENADRLSAGLIPSNHPAMIHTMVIEDWKDLAPDHLAAALQPFVVELGIRSSLFVPVSTQKRRIGGLSLHERRVRTWRKEDVLLVEGIGRQLGSAAERISLTERIRSQALQMQQVLETVPEGVLLLDESYRMVLTNPAARRYLEFLSEGCVQGQELKCLGDFSVEDICRSKTPWNEVEISGSTKKIFEIAAKPLQAGDPSNGWVLVLHDLTEERGTQARLQTQDRLATVGQLAAGIAHDFNNIMAAVTVYTDLLLLEPGVTSLGKERLEIIQRQVQRASSLIRQILDFSRRSVMEHSQMDILPFIKELDKLLGRVLPENIRIELNYQPGAYLVKADPTRLQQVFMNLALNARDAMPAGGVLGFELRRYHQESGEPAPLPDISPGDWVCIQVRDTGKGIPPEAMAHLFEPFFTTKPVGQGTGLGLAQVYGIIKQHGGSIDVHNQPGAGAMFSIYLPALAVSAPVAPVPLEGWDDKLGNGETILIVEDDRDARHALSSLLETYNYRMLTAENGRVALDLILAQEQKIDLVISDLIMPEMGGMELYHRLNGGRKSLRFLFITGHPMDEDNQALLEAGRVAWLQKPFSGFELTRLMRRLLSEPLS